MDLMGFKDGFVQGTSTKKKPPLKLNNRIYDLAYKPLKPSVALKDLKSKDCIHPAYSQNSDGTCFLRERQT